jgi:hypothetical protein
MSLRKIRPNKSTTLNGTFLFDKLARQNAPAKTRAKMGVYYSNRGCPLSEHKQEESFRVIDRRLFTDDGELRKEAVEEEARKAVKEEQTAKAAPQPADTPAVPSADAPKRSVAFEGLIRMIGSNAAMVLGAYADPRTGQPMLDPDAARELIDMLDALHEKTKGNLAPEEDSMLLDLLGKLKLTYLEVNQALAAQATQAKAKTR